MKQEYYSANSTKIPKFSYPNQNWKKMTYAIRMKGFLQVLTKREPKSYKNDANLIAGSSLDLLSATKWKTISNAQ